MSFVPVCLCLLILITNNQVDWTDATLPPDTNEGNLFPTTIAIRDGTTTVAANVMDDSLNHDNDDTVDVKDVAAPDGVENKSSDDVITEDNESEVEEPRDISSSGEDNDTDEVDRNKAPRTGDGDGDGGTSNTGDGVVMQGHVNSTIENTHQQSSQNSNNTDHPLSNANMKSVADNGVQQGSNLGPSLFPRDSTTFGHGSSPVSQFSSTEMPVTTTLVTTTHHKRPHKNSIVNSMILMTKNMSHRKPHPTKGPLPASPAIFGSGLPHIDSGRPESHESQSLLMRNAKYIVLGVVAFIILLVITLLVGCICKRKMKKDPGYITLDEEFGTTDPMNCNYDGEL